MNIGADQCPQVSSDMRKAAEAVEAVLPPNILFLIIAIQDGGDNSTGGNYISNMGVQGAVKLMENTAKRVQQNHLKRQ